MADDTDTHHLLETLRKIADGEWVATTKIDSCVRVGMARAGAHGIELTEAGRKILADTGTVKTEGN